MKINRNNLFIGILAFLILINILVGFSLDAHYIRAILAFIFIITIPGLLIMLMLKIREAGFWEYLVYTVGLSISFIMFGGLAVNWGLPALGITDKPLSLWPILICFDIFLLIFSFIAWKRNEDLDFKVKSPKLDLINRIFIIVPMLFPFLAILGAFLLNNHGTNILTMIMLGGIAVYVFMLVLLRDKLNPNIYPWAIWMISIAILLSGWMRSWYVSGPDISLEFQVFEKILGSNFWNLATLKNNYEAMLSTTILQTVGYLFIKIDKQMFFKLFSPLIFSITPLIVYLISKRFFKRRISFLASFFFIAQPTFISWLSIPIRQEIAFLFFGLIILTLFHKSINIKNKKILFFFFGISMVVSHYSTTYIGLAILLATYIIVALIWKYKLKGKNKMKLNILKNRRFYFSGAMILLIILFGFLWYSQLTTTSSGMLMFIKGNSNNLGNIFSEENRQTSSADPLFGFFKKTNEQDTLIEYETKIKDQSINQTNLFPMTKTSNYRINYFPLTNLKNNLKFSSEITTNKIIFYSKQVISKIFQFFMVIWSLIALKSLFSKNKKFERKQFYSLCIIMIGLSAIVFILPLFSIKYEFSRFIQQILIVLSFSAILGGLFIFKKIKKVSIPIMALLCIFFFLLFSGFIPQVIGGGMPTIQLNNLGNSYNQHYAHNGEITSGVWLLSNKYAEQISADITTKNKLLISGYINKETINMKIYPFSIKKKDFVYVGYSNKIRGSGSFLFNGLISSYNFPTEFLNENKNKVYNNGGSEIFK